MKTTYDFYKTKLKFYHKLEEKNIALAHTQRFQVIANGFKQKNMSQTVPLNINSNIVQNQKLLHILSKSTVQSLVEKYRMINHKRNKTQQQKSHNFIQNQPKKSPYIIKIIQNLKLQKEQFIYHKKPYKMINELNIKKFSYKSSQKFKQKNIYIHRKSKTLDKYRSEIYKKIQKLQIESKQNDSLQQNDQKLKNDFSLCLPLNKQCTNIEKRIKFHKKPKESTKYGKPLICRKIIKVQLAQKKIEKPKLALQSNNYNIFNQSKVKNSIKRKLPFNYEKFIKVLKNFSSQYIFALYKKLKILFIYQQLISQFNQCKLVQIHKLRESGEKLNGWNSNTFDEYKFQEDFKQ